MHGKTYIHVVCAIIENNGRILAALRSHAQSHGGFWEFPGGKIRPGEDPDEAIRREIKEELGDTVTVREEMNPVTFDYPHKTVLLMPLVCEADNASFAALEHEEIRWVNRLEAEALDWLPPDREILRNYYKVKTEKLP